MRETETNAEAKGAESGREVVEGGGRKEAGSPKQPFVLPVPSRTTFRGNIHVIKVLKY